MTTLTRNSVKFEWSEACKRSFKILKDRLTFASILTLPEGTKVFVVYYDASRVDLRCVLMHENYQTHDLELVAVVLALKI